MPRTREAPLQATFAVAPRIEACQATTMSLENATKDLRAAVTKLRAEQVQLAQQIATLERFLSSTGQLPKRRGRPPKALQAPQAPAKRGPGRPRKNAAVIAAVPTEKKRTKPKWSPAAREAARKRMQAYWAKKTKNA